MTAYRLHPDVARFTGAEEARLSVEHVRAIRCAAPVALNPGIKADGAAGAASNPRLEGKFAGTTRTFGAGHWNAEERSKHRSQQPQVEQKCCDVPEVPEQAQGVFGVEQDKRGGQRNNHEPPQLRRNAQLQLQVFPHAHDLIVLARALIRSLSHPGDMSQIT